MESPIESISNRRPIRRKDLLQKQAEIIQSGEQRKKWKRVKKTYVFYEITIKRNNLQIIRIPEDREKEQKAYLKK